MKVVGCEESMTGANGIGTATEAGGLKGGASGFEAVNVCDFAQHFLQTLNEIQAMSKTLLIIAAGEEKSQWSAVNGFSENSIFWSN